MIQRFFFCGYFDGGGSCSALAGPPLDVEYPGGEISVICVVKVKFARAVVIGARARVTRVSARARPR